jgi:hypothetical protein
MPPLSTPAMAIAFMIVLFVALVGVPRLFLHKHHDAK